MKIIIAMKKNFYKVRYGEQIAEFRICRNVPSIEIRYEICEEQRFIEIYNDAMKRNTNDIKDSSINDMKNMAINRLKELQKIEDNSKVQQNTSGAYWIFRRKGIIKAIKFDECNK